MSNITQEQKDEIIALSNARTPNREMVEILEISLPTILYWKRKLRATGFITADSPISTGRPRSTFHMCATCGQPVKNNTY